MIQSLISSSMRFDYCQLLLDEGENDAVIDRAKYTLNIAKENNWLSDIALDQLSIGRAYFQQAMYQDALIWIDQSISIFHGAGYIDILPFSLLNRAALHRHTRDFARAQADLQEVFDITDYSGMRLHLTDYHLEMARLLSPTIKMIADMLSLSN